MNRRRLPKPTPTEYVEVPAPRTRCPQCRALRPVEDMTEVGVCVLCIVQPPLFTTTEAS